MKLPAVVSNCMFRGILMTFVLLLFCTCMYLYAILKVSLSLSCFACDYKLVM